MKKKILILFMACLLLCGCKKDSFEDINIYTTAYPFRYVVEALYGEHSEISSIYPAEVDIENYTLTDKQVESYSKKADLYIFNGLNKERDYVIPMVKNNKNLKIINATLTMDYENSQNDLWLSPSNLLMIAQNIKNGLKEYISNYYLEEDINNNYETLRINLSNLDAKLRLIATNADNNTLVVSSNTFKFLEKYGFEIISVSSDDENSNTNISKAKSAFSAKTNAYLFIIKGTEENDTIKSMTDAGAKLAEINPMYTLTDDEIKNGTDYINVIKSFIDVIKEEVY